MRATSGEKLLAGRYKLGALIGLGGMAEVYDAFDERLARPVAVKLLRTEMAARADVRNRFEAEARAAARLSHPNVVAVFDTGEDAGVPYIVMERLPGETLADRMAAGPADPEWLRRVAGDVLGALAAAHSAGLVHRDVKPANILLAADGCAKVADFGIAKSLEETTIDLTATNQLVGTPAYLAPERVDGLPATPQSDLYSLGVVLYEGLSGRKPFIGATPLSVAYAVRNDRPPSLGEVCPGAPADLRAAVERAMERDPQRRFTDAREMAAAIGVAGSAPGRVAGDGAARTIEAIPLPPGGSGAAHPTATAELPLLEARPAEPGTRVATLAGTGARLHRWRTANPALAAAAAVLVVGFLLILGMGLLRPAGGDVSDALRDLAGRLGPADGSRADDLATALDRVADAVDAGGGGDAATALLSEVAGWRASGELSEAAAAEVTAALLRVQGARAPEAAPASTTTQVPPPSAPPPGSGDDGEGGEDQEENPARRGAKGKGPGKGKRG